MVQWNLFETGSMLAAGRLMRQMVGGVGRARTTFFDEYPSGKIINRVVKDSESLRVLAPMRIGDTVNSLIDLTVAGLVIAFASVPVALITLPVFFLFIYVQRNIAPVLQHLMVLRSARFGEVLHRESDVIDGVRTFCLYNHLPALTKRLTDAVYRFMQMHFLRGRVEAWGRLLCEFGTSFFAAAIVLAVHLAISRRALDPVMGAVIITASLRLNGTFNWLTWSLGQVFESAGHARRVFEYVDLPAEETEEGILGRIAEKGLRPSPLDAHFDLEFKGYSMSYRHTTPLILEDLNLKIIAGQKVGIVGRTGAGKSSLVQAIFRMVYVRGGDITIGGESLLAMDLGRARGLFSVVPQDPYLFEGSVRSNLDRLNEFKDSEIMAALSKVSLDIDLNHAVLEGGRNLSFGERQLLCLARVILSKRPYIIMDEPTSGVDSITDAIIQRVLASALGDRTIITIAHRLETLARMDRIVELRAGRVVLDGSVSEVLPLITAEDL
jgi:ABC-type multidrug transport system fused ATPase/permease subunit